MAFCIRFYNYCSWTIGTKTFKMFFAYQEGAEHVESDKINDGKSAAARHLLPGVVVWLRVTQFPWHAGQHDLLPRLSSGTSGGCTGITEANESLRKSHTHKRHRKNLNPTHLKRSSTAWGKVWKLLFLLICVPSTMATFPNTWHTNIAPVNSHATPQIRYNGKKMSLVTFGYKPACQLQHR